MSSIGNAAALFIAGVSKATGIDPRVLVSWVVQEGAYAPNGTGGFNFLNLRPYAGDPYSSTSSGGFEQFSSVDNAIAATVRRLKQPFAAPILAATKGTPSQQIAAIASTGWDKNHYGGNGGINLKATFAKIFTVKALASAPVSPDAALAVAATAGTGSANMSLAQDAASAGQVALSVATGQYPADAAKQAGLSVYNSATQWVNDLVNWVQNTAAYASVYVLLVMFAVVLGVLGLLRLLGVRFGSLAEAARSRGEAAA